MSTVTPDHQSGARSRIASGMGFAILSAASFGMSGSLARGLIDGGWSPAAAVTARVTVAAIVLAIPSALLLRGRWALLWQNRRLVLAYGLVAVAGCQLAYFNAVMHMEVGIALLIEYTAPVAVVCWLWLRHGQRPGRVTTIGAAIALAGLILVLDVLAGFTISALGVAWALASMVGAAVYFILSADEGNGLPPLVLAGSGLTVGALALGAAGLLGLVPMSASTGPASYDGVTVAWWLPVLALGVVAAAVAYSTGIAAGRRLGSRLASFVALSEVLAALVFAWLLLDEIPGQVQLAGGALILAGVVVVKLGEPRRTAPAQSSSPMSDIRSRS